VTQKKDEKPEVRQVIIITSQKLKGVSELATRLKGKQARSLTKSSLFKI
jgi:hypothetical protein